MTTQFDTIIDALHLTELPPEQQDELLTDINEMVFKGTFLRLIERMSSEARESFAELLDNEATEEELEAFIAQNVPNAEQAVKDTIADLTSDILAVTQE